jgi:AraC family transcriptional regulator, exoenzyme S synthesis regulatory protein ExsA
MLIRFPQVSKGKTDNSFIVVDDIPFAKHNKIDKSAGKQVGFLTEHTLFFIMQGKKNFHFGNETVTIDTHQLILLKRGIYSISEYIPDGGHFEALMIFVPDKFLKEFYFRTDRFPKNTKQKSPFTIIPSDELLDSFKTQYLTYFGKSFEAMDKIFQLKLHELFLLLIASTCKTNVLNFIQSCVTTQPIDIEFIVKNHLLQPLSIAEFAKLSSRSVASFKRDFKKQFNTSPKQWINQQRLSYANGLLNSTSKTVSEITYECGFESVSHFIKIFKKEYGITPNSLRAESAVI